MTKSVRMIIFAVSAVCILLMVFLFLHYSQLKTQLLSDTEQLAESRSSWEKTAAEKEELQTELNSLNAELKKAKLSLSESLARIDELEQDIAALNESIAALQLQLAD